MPYYVKMRRNGRLCGKLGPFSTQKLAVKQAQPLADDAADDVVVTVEPAATSNPKSKKKAKAKRRPRRRRNYSPVPGSPPLASATDSLVDWSPMNARTARSMERMGMAPRRRNGRRRNSTATKLHVYGWDDAGVRQAQHLAQRMRGQILDSGVEFDAEGDPEDFFIAKFPSAKAADAFRAAVPWSQGVKLARRRANPRRAPMPRGRAGTVRQGTLKLGK